MMLAMHAASHSASVFSPRNICVRQLQTIALMLLLAVCGAATHVQAQTKAPKSPLAAAIARVLAEGHDAILPPHVSNLLGISPQEQEVPVKQFAEMGEPIRGIEVSTADHNNVVIFVESRAQKESTFYLMSRGGVLRKVLSVQQGVGHSRQPTKDDKESFEKEKQHWVAQLAPKHR